MKRKNQTFELVPASGGFLSRPLKRPTVENTLYNRIREFLGTEFTGCSANTKARVKWSMDLLQVFCHDRDIDMNIIASFPEWLVSKRGHSPGTTSIVVAHLKRFLKWAYVKEYTTKDMSVHVPSVHVPRPPIPLTFSHDEYQQLKENSDGVIMVQWAFILAYNTGMSLVDCCYFRWSSVDLDKMMIECVRIKIKRFGDGAVCWIPIITNSDLHMMLLRFKRELKSEVRSEQDQDYVCPALARRYGTRSCGIKVLLFRKIREISSHKSFITFRRTFLSNLANSGMNLALACKISGHRRPETFLRYVRPDESALLDGMEKAFEYAKTKTKNPTQPLIIQPKAHRRTNDLRKTEPS